MDSEKNKSIGEEKNQKGCVYILTNPSFKEDWIKIGRSARPVDVRSKELDNTAVPLPFEIYAMLETSKYVKVEQAIHRQIDLLTDLRIRPNREFFNINPETALEIINVIATLLDDAKVIIYNNEENNDEENLSSQRKPRFKFDMAGLKPGDFITFDPLEIEVKIVTNDKIEYEDRLWSLSNFTTIHMPDDKKNESGSYQG
ncbi:MAG: GIY-YIG nuclease family protein, partial [Verrucomicrobia bacterium]|nr:GIY-YIG nuclease family protein [Verrucomicrobiota bacterium]